MTHREFKQSHSALQLKDFEIRSDPKDSDRRERIFKYVSHSPTDVTIQHVATLQSYLLPLSVIGLITLGVLWLNRGISRLTDDSS